MEQVGEVGKLHCKLVQSIWFLDNIVDADDFVGARYKNRLLGIEEEFCGPLLDGLGGLYDEVKESILDRKLD